MADNPGTQDRDTKFFSRIRALYDRIMKGESDFDVVGADDDFAREELRAVVDRLLGEGYDDEKVRELAETQLELRRARQDLTIKLHKGQITPEEFLAEQHRQLDWAFDSCEAVLGHEDCVKFMGGDREELRGFIDEKAFFQSYRD